MKTVCGYSHTENSLFSLTETNNNIIQNFYSTLLQGVDKNYIYFVSSKCLNFNIAMLYGIFKTHYVTRRKRKRSIHQKVGIDDLLLKIIEVTFTSLRKAKLIRFGGELATKDFNTRHMCIIH